MVRSKSTKAVRHKRRYPGVQIKYDTNVPQNVTEAFVFAKENENTYWRESSKKKMDTIMHLKTFEELDSSQGIVFRNNPGYQYMKVWLIFDIKADGRRKSRLTLGGHMANARDIDVYASHMKQESSQMLAVIAAANGKSTLIGDVENANLCAKTEEEMWAWSDEIFHQMGYAKKEAIMRLLKAQYGAKSPGHA